VRIGIEDNGRGFGFSGVAEAGSALLAEFGPKTLRERVEALNGTIRIQSSTCGASLQVVLPLATA
jgi:signal transduction histidine kinase